MTALATACSGAPAVPSHPLGGACQPDRLDVCAKRMAASSDEPVDPKIVADYAAARAARDPADAWARLYRELGEAKGAVVVAEGGAAIAAKAARVIAIPSLPAPGGIGADDLLLVMAQAAGISDVVRARDGEITQLFPADPLAPFLAGLRPAARGDAAHLDADIALAQRVRAAFEAAGAFRYLDAAHEAEQIAALVAGRDPHAEPVRRARYALQLLGAAGLVLDPAPPAAAEGAPPSAGETPYGALLAVLGAKDPQKAWEARGALVLAGIAADRRDDVAALFTRPKDCGARRAPPMEGARDLVFASRLAGALARDPVAAARPGQLPLTDWLARYEAAARLVERTHTAWSHLPALLTERGDATGLGLSGSAAYRRVTELGLMHIAATRALERAEPARYRAFTQLGLSLAPGLLGDVKLQKAMVELTEASIEDKLAAASDPDSVLSAVATGALAGLSYPPGLAEAHLGALQAAVAAKLKGELLDRSGWGVAALYAGDALYRIAADAAPNLDWSARQIGRALAGPNVAEPALAALATAAARYAALALSHRLDPGVTRPERFPPARRAARDELRAAIAGLGAPGEAPDALLDDIADLADGLVAVVSTAMAASSAKKKAAGKGAPKAACGAQRAVALDPRTRRALARLGDVRRRILAQPRLKQGDTTWAKRARLVVTVLSDAMDLAIASDTRKPPVFAVTAADAEKAWHETLDQAAPRGVAASLASGYALLRTFAASPTPEALVQHSGRDLRRLAGGLLTLFQGDGKGPAMGVALLDALAGAKGGLREDLSGALVAYAGVLYAGGRSEQADLCLLAALVASSITRQPPPEAAAALAEKYGSRVGWALRFTREIRKNGKGELPDPAAYADAMRRATDDACQAADADATIEVMAAIRAFGSGRRREAREALDRVLARADERGLGVPRMVYRYDEKTATKAFSVDIGISYGSGVLLQGSTFQLGLAVRSGGEPEGSLTATLSPLDAPKAGEDAARYYVYAAALATVYHLLEGDTERATQSGRRVVSALSNGLALGSRRLLRERPAAWGEDAREILAVAAQLAAEAGMPFLAGDLWTVVRQGFADTLDDQAVSTMLDRLPLGLAGLADLDKVVARARRSLRVLAEPMPCTEAKVELGAFDEVTCEEYPLALSLRVADALKKLPRLERGARCGVYKTLDAFLAAAAKGTYDPDAFTRAMEALRAAGKPDDAAVLLARQKRPSHCSPAIVSAARALGRSALLGPALRADLLSSAVNCTAMTGGPEVEADVLALDEETRRLPDPSRNLKLLLSVADLASRTDRWETAAKLVDRPDFLGRWLSIHPNAAAAALVLDHAVAAIRRQPVAVERTKATYQLLCESFPSPERAELCAQAAALREPGDKVREAKEAIRKLVAR